MGVSPTYENLVEFHGITTGDGSTRNKTFGTINGCGITRAVRHAARRRRRKHRRFRRQGSPDPR